jgi:hypothetical protein
MAPEVSLTCSQHPTTGTYPEPTESYFLPSTLILSFKKFVHVFVENFSGSDNLETQDGGELFYGRQAYDRARNCLIISEQVKTTLQMT